MICKNCGKDIDDNAVVCPYCGVQVSALNSTAATTSANEVKNVNGVGIASFIVGLLSFGLGFIFAIVPLIALGLSIGGMVKRK